MHNPHATAHEDRPLAAAFVAQMGQPESPSVLRDHCDTEQLYELAHTLVTVARRLGWTPPPKG